MRYLITLEYRKLTTNHKFLSVSLVTIGLIFAYEIAMSLVAYGNSFGAIFQEAVSLFSTLVLIYGAVSSLLSLTQDIQQKTLKNLLVTPVSRFHIILAKLLSSIGVSLILLVIIFLTTFIVTGLFFGFFETGLYDSAHQAQLDFIAGLLNILSGIVSIVFYSSLLLLFYLSFNSLSVTLIALVLLRGLGELISRNIVHNNHIYLTFSPLGGLNIVNPILAHQPLWLYVTGLLLALCYAGLFLVASAFLFQKKEV